MLFNVSGWVVSLCEPSGLLDERNTLHDHGRMTWDVDRVCDVRCSRCSNVNVFLQTHAGGRVAVRLWAAQLGFPNKDAQLWDCGGWFALQMMHLLALPVFITWSDWRT